ncbi:MAG: RNA polymerase sigma-70 factor (ECF subfamily) [Verrucomicrobiales bacterium]|jgi:RNA polymerase sigma-70 factor (ECF subfamily)
MIDPIQSDDFAVLYSKHHLDLLRYVMTLLPNRAQAEDVVQETARRLWQKFNEYDSSRPFWPWARQFAFFEVLKHRKKYAIRAKYFQNDELIETLAEERVEMEPELEAKRNALVACMKKLDPNARDLMTERFGRERALKDIAKEQGKSANAIYLVMHRIRKQLLDCVSRCLRLEEARS